MMSYVICHMSVMGSDSTSCVAVLACNSQPLQWERNGPSTGCRRKGCAVAKTKAKAWVSSQSKGAKVSSAKAKAITKAEAEVQTSAKGHPEGSRDKNHNAYRARPRNREGQNLPFGDTATA